MRLRFLGSEGSDSPFSRNSRTKRCSTSRRFVDLSDRIVGYLEKRIVEESGGSTGLTNKVESAIETLHIEFELTGAALKAVASKSNLGKFGMIVERCEALETQFSAARRTYQLETRLSRVQQEADRVKALRQQAEEASAILMTLSTKATDPEALAGIKEAVGVAGKHDGLASLWQRLKSDENLLGGKDLEAYKEAFHATAKSCDNLQRASPSERGVIMQRAASRTIIPSSMCSRARTPRSWPISGVSAANSSSCRMSLRPRGPRSSGSTEKSRTTEPTSEV